MNLTYSIMWYAKYNLSIFHSFISYVKFNLLKLYINARYKWIFLQFTENYAWTKLTTTHVGRRYTAVFETTHRLLILNKQKLKIIYLFVGHSMSSGPWAPTLTCPILMKFYLLLHILFKLCSVKFQLQIINGFCISISNVEVAFGAEG